MRLLVLFPLLVLISCSKPAPPAQTNDPHADVVMATIRDAVKTRGLTLDPTRVSPEERMRRTVADSGFCTGFDGSLRYFERNYGDGSPKEAWTEHEFPDGWAKDGEDVTWYGETGQSKKKTVVYEHGKAVQIYDF